jgi:uncharacterized protein YecE (DUF72 family)
MKPVRIGCSGWAYKDWDLYPEKLPQRRWLERYAEVFDTVEVNSSFYRLPAPTAVEKWIADTPADFAFAVKGSRYLTHVKRLNDFERYLERFRDRIEPLGAAGKLGPVLWQLPANFHRNDQRLAGALDALSRWPGRHGFEFRHPSWFAPEVVAMLRGYQAALVIGDDPSRPFQTHEVSAPWTYVRFHQGAGADGGSYTKRELAGWRRRIAAWRSRIEVFAYFNNAPKALAPANAIALRSSLS